MTRVETGARLHFGFQNLALAHERLYGGVGVALAEPRVVLDVERAEELTCPDPELEPYARDAVDLLDVAGARVDVEERFDRHVGLGSGTQLALACLVGIADAYDRPVDPRATAPELGRGGRSGVGVATFESGGFVVDAGHPTRRFTGQPPDAGTWTVPQPVVQRSVPENWRFVLLTPDVGSGQSGENETESMQTVVQRANPGIADEIATLLVRQLLPAVVEEDLQAFGEAVARLGRLNGAWYADEQGGVYRPPAGRLLETLESSSAIAGVGQSSWGPTVYAITDREGSEAATRVARRALTKTNVDGTISVVAPRNDGATVTR
jgi:beta-ribofuranosylaminobenzene 5'-phosphate synthase